MSTDDREIEGHDYDGIREFDNPLPMWWLVTFFGTIIFAFLYYLHYEIAGGPSLAQELKQGLVQLEVQAQKIKMEKGGSAPEANEEMLAALEKDSDAMKKAQQHYSSKCAACHGAELQGQIGPNLLDNYWIHGRGTRKDILVTIANGVAEKGMPAWAAVLPENEMQALAAFVHLKKGQQVPGAKAPQGELIQ